MPIRWSDIPISSCNSVASDTTSHLNDVQDAVEVSTKQLESHDHQLRKNSFAGSSYTVTDIGIDEAQHAVACQITDLLPLGKRLDSPSMVRFDLGPHGIWYGLLLSLTIAAVLLFARFHYLSKKLLTNLPNWIL